ncbi:MAG TPA: type VI secretion system contractile sheath large subunit [Bryobacteraceae bacterium]|jgi:type VI secretion system protein ImpC
MARRFSFGEIELDVNAGQANAVAEAEPLRVNSDAEDPFRILVLGDFSGRGASVARPMRVDRDNLDQVIRALRPEAAISLGDKHRTSFSLTFDALEHFEPDSVFERCELFRLIGNPSRAIPPSKVASGASEELQADVTRLGSGSLLDALAEKHDAAGDPASGKSGSPRARDELQEIIERIAGPHLQRRPDAEASQAAAEHAERLGLLMRAILHEPHFQTLEAAWRSLDFLIRNIEDRIQVYLFDISKERLTADLLQNPEFRSTNTYRVMVEESVRGPGAEPWTLFVGNYVFDRNSPSDVDLLLQLGLLARAARAPFLAEAVPWSGGHPAASQSWQTLRESSHAAWLGLAIPRLLLRLPYGKDTATTASFDFEEISDPPRHQEYLWGNPAFGCAYLLALSFSRFGWDFRPGMHREIGGLPLHIYKREGVMHAQPCAEVLLTESDWDELLDQGLMPFVSVRDRDSVRLIRFQSIAAPPTALSGRWI